MLGIYQNCVLLNSCIFSAENCIPVRVFRSISFAKISFIQRKCERKRKFSLKFFSFEIFAKFVRNFCEIPSKSYFFSQNYNLFHAKQKNFDLYRTKIERKFRRKYIEICENFERNERISIIHFPEFRSTKISMETLILLRPANTKYIFKNIDYFTTQKGHEKQMFQLQTFHIF